MSGKIYLLQEDDTLQSLSEQPYSSEDLLQTLLEKYPDLLAGDQIDESEPRRWLLVSREVGVPSEEGGYDQWSLDHLFLDQDGIPTLVEVKRSSDTRIRREVVGQMLDYAANAVVYWPVETIRAKFETECELRGQDPAQLIRELINAAPEDEAVDRFWNQVKTNLQAQRIRMVFVADEVPSELKRIVEFLNEQMDPAEALAVEIKQYAGGDLKTLVPRVIGLTSEAQQKKSSEPRETREWNEDLFLEELRARGQADQAAVAEEMFDWARATSLRTAWGSGKVDGIALFMVDQNGGAHYTFTVRTGFKNPYVQLPFGWMQTRQLSPFDNESKRHELRERLNRIRGIKVPPDAVAKFPGIYLSQLRDKKVLEQFLEAFDWCIQEIRALEEEHQ